MFGVPEGTLPAMTGAEMQTTREFLGLTRGWLAAELQMQERRMMRMEADQERIPDALVSKLDEVLADTKDVVTNMIAQYRRATKRTPGEDVFLRTYKTDESFEESPDYRLGVAGRAGYPAKWHRMCCARVCEAVSGLVITYQDMEQFGAGVEDFSDTAAR